MNIEEKPIPLVIIMGPTAVGKTDVAVEVAEKLKTEIISADSRQIYKGMNIGTAKPSEDLQKRVKHHLIDVSLPSEIFTVADYKKLAESKIKELYEQGKIPLVVGGTGLYIRALLRGLCEAPNGNWEFRALMEDEERKMGIGHLHRKLMQIDSKAAEKLHPHDLRRIIRALEVYYKKGKPLSEMQKDTEVTALNYNPIKTCLIRSKSSLQRRIDDRIDTMMKNGFLSEVQGLLKNGLKVDTPALTGIGYKQLINYLQGFCSLEEAILKMKKETTKFTKRQMTWFRAEKELKWLDMDKEENPVSHILLLAEEVNTL